MLALAVVITACGDDDDASSSSTGGAATAPAETGDISADEKAANKIAPMTGASDVSLTVGSKNFTEQYVLGEIYAQALEAAGYKVKTDLKLGDGGLASRPCAKARSTPIPSTPGRR